jgi:CRISPR system Cascade subunit CasA
MLFATVDGPRADPAPTLSPAILEWISHLTDEVIDPNHLLRIRALGMVYGSQNSTPEEIIDDAMSLRAVLLRQGTEQLTGIAVACVEAAERVARAVGHLAGNLASASGGDPVGPRDRATETTFAELDSPFRTWLAGLRPDSDPTDQQIVWHHRARRIAIELSTDLIARAPTTAWVGRMVRGRWLTSNHAADWFHRELRAAIPFAYDDAEAA